MSPWTASKRATPPPGRRPKFTINVPERKANDNFAFKFTGAVKIPRDGQYTFTTGSDDGSRLYIDGNSSSSTTASTPKRRKRRRRSQGRRPRDHGHVLPGRPASEVAQCRLGGPATCRGRPIPADALFSVGGRPMVPLKHRALYGGPAEGRRWASRCSACSAAQTATRSPASSRCRPAKTLAANRRESAEGCLGDHVRRRVCRNTTSAPTAAPAPSSAAMKDRAELAKRTGRRRSRSSARSRR